MKKHITGCQCQVFLFLRVGWQALLHGATISRESSSSSSPVGPSLFGSQSKTLQMKIQCAKQIALIWWTFWDAMMTGKMLMDLPSARQHGGANASLLPLGCCCNEPGVLRPQARGDEACANPSPRFSVRPTSICPPTGTFWIVSQSQLAEALAQKSVQISYCKFEMKASLHGTESSSNDLLDEALRSHLRKRKLLLTSEMDRMRLELSAKKIELENIQKTLDKQNEAA